jgi:hypothetical protein
MEYREFFVEELYRRQLYHPAKSFSFYAYRSRGMNTGQGADGFSFWSSNLDGIDRFYRDHIQGHRVAFHDDLWISYFLLRQNIQVVGLQNVLDGGLVYRSVHLEGALKELGGEFARETLARDGLRHLRQSAPVPLRTQIQIGTRDFLDRGQRIAGKVARRVGGRTRRSSR